MQPDCDHFCSSGHISGKVMWLLRRSTLHFLARLRGIALTEDVCARASACLLGTKHAIGSSTVLQHSVQQALHQGKAFGSIIQQQQDMPRYGKFCLNQLFQSASPAAGAAARCYCAASCSTDSGLTHVDAITTDCSTGSRGTRTSTSTSSQYQVRCMSGHAWGRSCAFSIHEG